MTKLLAAQPAPSNKRGEESNGPYTSAFAYSVALSHDHSIRVTAPIVDKITVTLPVHRPSAELDVIKAKLGCLKKSVPQPVGLPFKAGSVKYSVNVHLRHVLSGEYILVQADPRLKKAAYLRFEFNPAKLGPTGITFWREIVTDLLGLPELWSPTASTATVTRIDLACDIVGVAVSRLAISSDLAGKTHAYFGIKGKVETVYLGLNGRNSSISVYNKRVELEERGVKPPFGDEEHTRVEIRYIPRCPVGALAAIKNRFARVDLKYLPRVAPGIESHAWQHFTDSVRYRGLTPALEPVPDALKTAYKSGLDVLVQPIWQPKSIWSRWADVLATSGLEA